MRNTLMLLFVWCATMLSAQEVVTGLIGNPQIKNQNFLAQPTAGFGTKHLYLYKEATSPLPFIDDFSSNKIKKYSTDTTSALFSNTLYYYLYEVNGAHPDTIQYSADTTYHYLIGKTDSTPNPSFNIYKYDFSVYPPIIYDTIKGVFPPYHLVNKFAGNPDTVSLNPSYVTNVLYLAHLFNDDNSLWTGRGIFENTNYPINPPTIGVATFDAVDERGELYLGANNIPKVSDSLVSKPMDLSTLLTSDNLYLSFYVESEGFGDAPEIKDTLVLQFYNAAHKWVNVWSSNAKSSWPSDTFIPFFVPINSSIFFHTDFKFRFFNYSSVSGYVGDLSNRDHWHLDYVVLDKNRAQDDHYVSDVAFKYPPQTLINGYYSVPWAHFKSASNVMLPSSQGEVNNISITSSSVDFTVDIKEKTNSVYTSASTQNFPIAADDFHNFTENYGSFVYFSSQNDTATFDVRYALNTTLLGNFTGNDTVYFQQQLANFYAYDNSTVEAGYGFYDAGAEFAYKFNILEGKGDTLRGVWIYFNEVIGHTNYLTPFTFRVRANNAGLPGALIWESPTTLYVDSAQGINQFLYYQFNTPNFLKDSCYIGFHQTTSDYINVGLDLNTIATNKMFYKTINGWSNSVVKGAVMLHPVFGKKVSPKTEIEELQNLARFIVFPNPASAFFYLEGDAAFQLSVIDIQGKEVHQQNCSSGRNTIQVDALPAGIYVLKMLNPSSQEIQYQKLVLQ